MIKDDLVPAINALADKLHVPAKAVYDALIQQAHIAVYFDAMLIIWWSIWSIVAGIVLYKLHHRFVKRDRFGEKPYLWNMGIGGFISTLLLSAVGYYLYDFFTALYNPAYWAILQIVSKIGGH